MKVGNAVSAITPGRRRDFADPLLFAFADAAATLRDPLDRRRATRHRT
jgi:hypothetical protein